MASDKVRFSNVGAGRGGRLLLQARAPLRHEAAGVRRPRRYLGSRSLEAGAVTRDRRVRVGVGGGDGRVEEGLGAAEGLPG